MFHFLVFMEKRNLRDLEVSAIGVGCMGFSHGYGKVPEDQYSIEAIQDSYKYGCTFFDTAEVYGAQGQKYFGHNEEIVGKALKDVRNNVVIATKFFIVDQELQAGKPLEQLIRDHLTESLKRLQTNYVDLYYLHRVNSLVPIEDVARVMRKLIDEKLIKGWGLSQVGVDILQRAHEITPVTAVQNLYNILERDCEKDVFPYCLEHNIGVVPFSPVGSGLLSGTISNQTQFEKVDDVRNLVPQLRKENIEGNQPILNILQRYAQLKNATMAQISMAWMLHKYPNCVPIPGSKNTERIIENLGAAKIKFTDEEFASFEREINACKIFGHRGHIEEYHQKFLKDVIDK